MPKRCTGCTIMNAKIVPVLICVVFDQNALYMFHQRFMVMTLYPRDTWNNFHTTMLHCNALYQYFVTNQRSNMQNEYLTDW